MKIRISSFLFLLDRRQPGPIKSMLLVILEWRQPGPINSVLLVMIGWLVGCLFGWLVGNSVFSETALRIFLIFCMKLGDYKGRKVTEAEKDS